MPILEEDSHHQLGWERSPWRLVPPYLHSLIVMIIIMITYLYALLSSLIHQIYFSFCFFCLLITGRLFTSKSPSPFIDPFLLLTLVLFLFFLSPRSLVDSVIQHPP